MELHKLAEPFPAKDIEWRVSRAGERNGKPWARVLAYVTNRAIMDRLDNVCGIANWRNEYTAAPSGGVLCGISVRVGHDWITKWDGAENTDIESVKGGLSGSMKRAAVQWGIGRYLYNLTEDFAVISDNGSHYQPAKQGKYPAFKWAPPSLPAWAVPEGDTTTAQAATPQEAQAPPKAKPAMPQQDFINSNIDDISPSKYARALKAEIDWLRENGRESVADEYQEAARQRKDEGAKAADYYEPLKEARKARMKAEDDIGTKDDKPTKQEPEDMF